MTKAETDELYPIFLQLVDEIKKLNDPLAIIIRTHLYLEFFMDKAIETLFEDSSILKERDFTFYLKLKTLKGLGLLNETDFYNVRVINEIRNSFAHSLVINIQSFNDKIKNLKPSFPDQDFEKMSDVDKMGNTAIYIMGKLSGHRIAKLEYDDKKPT